MLQVILKKSWKQHSTKQLLYIQLPLFSKTIQKYAGHYWRSKDKLISDFLPGPLHIDVPVLANQQ